MTLTTYDPATGDLDAVRTGSNLEDLLSLIGSQPYVLGAHSPLFYKVDLATNEVVEK